MESRLIKGSRLCVVAKFCSSLAEAKRTADRFNRSGLLWQLSLGIGILKNVPLFANPSENTMSQYPPNQPQDFSQPQNSVMTKKVETKTSKTAVFSLVFGVLSFVFSCFAGLIGIILGIVALVKINKSNGRLGGQPLAIIGIVLSVVLSMFSLVLVGIMLPAIQQVRHAARRAATAGEIRQIALSELNYESNHGKFSGTGLDETTGSGLSWRVHLLPYFGEEALYQRFKLDEPWDSQHNKQLIYEMPAIYAAKLGSQG